MPVEAWNSAWVRSMGLMLNGKTLGITDDEGVPVKDDSFLLLVNASHEGVEFALPAPPNGRPWCQLLSTENLEDPFAEIVLEEKMVVGGRAMVVLCDRDRP